MIRLIFRPFGPSDTKVQLPGYQPSIGTHGMILRYFCTISPLSFIRISVLYGALFGMLLVPLAGEREDAPDLRLAAGLGEDLGLLARDLRGGLVHLLLVVHDAVGAVFGEDHEVHAGQADLHAVDHVAMLRAFASTSCRGVQPRHLVVDDGNADRVVAARDIAM
jgi:hypothetical protein